MHRILFHCKPKSFVHCEWQKTQYTLQEKIYCSLRIKSPANKQKYECMRAQVDMRPGTKSFPAIFQFYQHGVQWERFEWCRSWNWTWRFATGIRKRAYWILFQQRPYVQIYSADVRKASWYRQMNEHWKEGSKTMVWENGIRWMMILLNA